MPPALMFRQGQSDVPLEVHDCAVAIIDCVTVHEQAHLLHHNHSATFGNEVAKILPDYRVRNQWLKVNGMGLRP
jgi:predicted metal-dependent hydrolase